MRNLTVNGKPLAVTQFCGGSNIGRFLMQALKLGESGLQVSFIEDDEFSADFVLRNKKGETITIDGIVAADAIIENFATYFDKTVEEEVAKRMEGSRILDVQSEIEETLRSVLAKLEYIQTRENLT